MIIQKPSNYDELDVTFSVNEPVEAGAHYMVILGAKEKSGTNANGEWRGVNIFVDCHETDYQSGAIRSDHERRKAFKPDGWWPPAGSKLVFLPKEDDPESGKSLKAFIETLEASNAKFKYDWSKPFDEQIKGKLIGGVIREKEWAYDGKSGFYPELWYFIPTEDVPNAKKPNPKYLDGKKATTPEPEVEPEPESFLPFDL